MRKPATVELERAWEQVLDRLGERLSAEEVRRLLSPLRPVGITPSELRLLAPNRLALVCVTETYLEPLRDCVSAVLGPRQIRIGVAERAQGELFREIGARRGPRRASTAAATLNPRYTFASFVVGASNQFAHAASRAVASQPGEHYNPLFIYGGVGLGKTHLATAIGNHVLDQRPRARVVCLSADAFMSELISSLRRDRMADFKERVRQVDVLILDDVQLLAGRERTQEEFFHTFNALHDGHRQIVVTSDKVPKEIAGLEERLRNRFEWGLIADIQPPDVETRVAILEKKAEIEGIPLPREVALYLGTQLASNVRELEGMLTRLGATASIGGQPITVDLAREVLETVTRPDGPRLTASAVIDAVCTHFGLRPSDLRSKRRSRNVVGPRHVAMYLCRRLLDASFPHIGELFARDHSTVMHGIGVTQRRLKDDPALQAAVERLERGLRQQ